MTEYVKPADIIPQMLQERGKRDRNLKGRIRMKKRDIFNEIVIVVAGIYFLSAGIRTQSIMSLIAGGLFLLGRLGSKQKAMENLEEGSRIF